MNIDHDPYVDEGPHYLALCYGLGSVAVVPLAYDTRADAHEAGEEWRKISCGTFACIPAPSAVRLDPAHLEREPRT